MKITIHQPNFFPRLKVIQKICMSELYVILDDVQYSRREFQNRCKLRHYSDPNNIFWITANVNRSSRKSLIKDILLYNPEETKKRILGCVKSSYHKSPHLCELNDYLEKAVNIDTESLNEFCTHVTLTLLDYLGINIPHIRSSSLTISENNPTNRIVEICTCNLPIFRTGCKYTIVNLV
jgi:hypothetical protein